MNLYTNEEMLKLVCPMAFASPEGYGTCWAKMCAWIEEVPMASGEPKFRCGKIPETSDMSQ